MSPINTADGPMWEGSSPEALSKMLVEFEETLLKHGMPSGNLKGGLSAQEVDDRLSEHGLIANDELKVWFGWHDGETRPWALGIVSMASVGEALEGYRANRAELERAVTLELAYEALTWGADEGWLRLERSSEALTIECTKPSGPPRLRWANEEFAYLSDQFRAVSLCTPVANWLTAAQNGAFNWNAATGSWDIDNALISTGLTGSLLG